MPTIKQEMSAIDRRELNFWESLSDEDQKKLSMWLLMRWASAVNSNVREIEEHYLVMINELVNVHFNLLRHDPDWQLRLMQCVGIGTSQRHEWIKPMKKKGTTSKRPKLYLLFEREYPHLNHCEIELLISKNTDDDLKEWLRGFGMSDKDIKAHMK